MKVHEYREMMRYLTRKPLSEQELQIASDINQQMPVASGESFTNEKRMGFAKAGLASNEPVKAGELLSYLKKYGVDIHPGNLSRASQLYGIESPSSGKYILPSENEIPIIKDKLYKNIKSGTTIEGRKNFDERNKLVKELVASEKYNPTEMKEIIQKKYGFDMGNTIQKEINQQRKEGKIIPSAREGETSTNAKKLLNDLNLLDKNKKIKDILSNPEFDLKKDYPGIFKEAKNTLNLDDSKTNYRLASLLKSYSEEKLPSNKNVINNSNEIYSSYLKDRPFGSLGSVLYRKQQVEPGVASQINEDPNFFSNTRKKISRLLPGENIYSTDELKNLISSYENKTGPYSLFVQGIKKDINLGKGRTIDKVINRVEKELQSLDPKDIDYLDKRETIKNKYNERVKEFTNKYNKDLKKGELPVRGLELSFDTPKNSLARYNELKKINPDLIEGVEDIYNKYNYSFKVDADVKTIPEALGFVKSPEGQKFMQKAANVNAARVYADPTGIGNFLETSVGQSLSKSAPNLLKTTAKLSAVTGTPINALIGVALYADEFKEKGLSDLETIAAGAYKGSTQDLLNFGDLIFRKLPVATYEKFVEDKPFLESLLDKPEYFEFADKQIDKYSSGKSIKDRVQNIAEYEVRKSVIPNVSDTEVPATISSEEVNNKITEILNLNPDLKKQYKQETTITPEPKKDLSQNLMLGPIVFPKYTQEELNLAKGGRVKFANGSDDPESDLYIPPLDKSEKTFKEGIYNTKRLGPEDSLSKYKSYSEEELLGNIEAKYPNQLQSFSLEDYLLNTMPMFEPKDVAPPKSYSPMPVEKYLKKRYQIDLAEGGPSDPSKRRFIKGTGILGAVGIASNFIPDLFQMAKKAKVIPKKAPFINIVRPLGKTDTEFPEWFPTLVSRFRKDGETIPIYRTEKIPITEKEFNEGIKKTEKIKGEKFYANPRTEEYFRQNPNELPYYKTKETEDIIGYEYVDKKLPDVKVVEVEGKEASVFFKNYYGADVEINYKSPGVMDEGSFYVKDYQPEAGSALDSAPDFEETFVKNIDEVLGGASQLEKYATKSKTARYTKGDAMADEIEGRAQSELDRMKDEGLFDE
jgi:bifunctional DNA-binding transcriptional regulator/antitoxin component of YhaV-PrlF toxin-antitoxin module